MMADSNEEAVADVLERAADLIEPEGAWCQHVWARNEAGQVVSFSSPEALCWCIEGAIARYSVVQWAGHNQHRKLMHLLGFRNGIAANAWNDVPERTQAEVVAKLREAAALARAATLVKEGGR